MRDPPTAAEVLVVLHQQQAALGLGIVLTATSTNCVRVESLVLREINQPWFIATVNYAHWRGEILCED